MSEYIPLEEWAKFKAQKLHDEFKTHFKVWEVQDPEGLMRLCMGSVRNWILDQNEAASGEGE